MPRAPLALVALLAIACRTDKDAEPLDSAEIECDVLWYIDYDFDGLGSDAFTMWACDPPEGWVDNADDCDDTNPDILADRAWYADRDADGWGADDDTASDCVQPEGYTDRGGDCDDADAEIHPDAEEICNDGVDNDCDGLWPDACAQVVDSAHAVLEGLGADDAFGVSVRAAGDVTGDGVDDLWVGANLADVDGVGADAGAIYLVPGPIPEGSFSVSELATSTLVGAELDRSGLNMAGGLDLGGDGGPDLAAGARRADADLGNETGSVFLWFDVPDGQKSQLDADAFIYGQTIWDRFGDGVVADPDLTGDGDADLLVGAPYYDPSSTVRNAGAVYLIPGPFLSKTYHAEVEATLILEGEDSDDLVGRVLSSMDLGGDGQRDLVIGAWVHSDAGAQSGAVYIHSGQSEGVISMGDADEVVSGLEAGDNFGRSLSSPGDMDGDGTDDLLVGAPGQDLAYADAGALYLLSGVSPDPEAPIAVFTGADNGDGLGAAVAGGGDVDGDGELDVLVSAPAAGSLGEGAVYLFYGPFAGERSAAEADARFEGEAAQDALGGSLGMLPDLAGRGDERHDLLMGSPASDRAADDAGALFLLFDVEE